VPDSATPAPASPTPPSPSAAPASRAQRLSRFVSRDTTGGLLLLGATVLALVIANSPAGSFYAQVRDTTFGPEALHLHLSVGTWAADGLLAIFFFVVGLELKQEFVAGSLRDPRVATLPIAAAVGGVALPALIFTAINIGAGPDALQGWAIPAATDIAFAVAVVAVVGKRLPPALRTFLLTLAVVDDLIAITIIAIFYTAGIAVVPLLLALLPLAAFAVLVRRGVRSWWLLIPLGVVAWALVHASGIHATIAGVALGLLVPAIATRRAGVTHVDADGHEERHALTHHFAERWSPISSGVAVPIFAFFSAGVSVGGCWSRASPASSSTRASAGPTSSASRSSRASGSPSRCSSASSPTAPAASRTTWSRSACSSGRSSQPCSAASCCRRAAAGTSATGPSRASPPRSLAR